MADATDTRRDLRVGPETEGPPYLCANCGAPALRRCRICKLVAYCSERCRKSRKDPSHARACRPPPIAPYSVERAGLLTDLEDLGAPAAVVAVREAARACGCPLCAAPCRRLPGAYDPHHIRWLQARWARLNSERADARATISKADVEGSVAGATISKADAGRAVAGATISKADAGRAGVSEADKFWAQFQQDYHVCENSKDGGVVFYLRPRLRVEAGEGHQAAFLSQTGDCAHLGPGGCELPRHEMPVGCVTFLGCDPQASREISKPQASLVWGGAVGRAVLADFEAAIARLDPNPEAVRSRLGTAGIVASQKAATGADAAQFLRRVFPGFGGGRGASILGGLGGAAIKLNFAD